MAQYLSLKTYANNEIRLSRYTQPLPPKKGGDSDMSREKTRYAERLQEATSTFVLKGFNAFVAGGVVGSVGLQHVSKREATDLLRRKQTAKKALDITREFQRKAKHRANKRIKRPRTITGYGRRTLLEGGQVAERWAGGADRTVLVTLTVPGFTKDSVHNLPNHIGYFINRLLQVLRRRFKKVLWYYCLELQKRGVLHLHVALTSDVPSEALRAGECVKEKWETLVKDSLEKRNIDLTAHRSGRFCWVPALWQNRVEVCRKSVAAYLSKYLSKSGSGGGNGFQDSPTAVAPSPGQWWGMSRKLLAMVKQYRLAIRFPVPMNAARVEELFASMQKALREHCPVMCYEKSFTMDNKHGQVCVEGTHYIAYMQPETYPSERLNIIADCIHAIAGDVCIASMQGDVVSAVAIAAEYSF